MIVHAFDHGFDGIVGFIKGEEGLIAQSAEQVSLRDPHSGLHLGLVARLSWSRWENSDVIVGGHHAVGSASGSKNDGLLIPLLRLSGTSTRGQPPKNSNMRTCDPIQSGSDWVQVASA